HGADTPGDRRTLPAALTTYPEIFKRTLGYDTAGFFGGLWFSDAMGTLQGFDTRRYDFLLQGTEAHVGRWKERRRATAPHLLVLHTFEAHEPYGARNHPWPPRAGVHPLATAAAPTAGTDRWEELVGYFTDRDVRDAVRGARDREALARIVHWMQHGCEEDPRPDALARLREAYEAGAAWVDGLLRNTCSWLEAEGLLDDDTILIVTSDHGEAFGEEGLIGHGRGLQDELVRIPLVIRGPAPFRGGKIVRGPFGLIDVFPTLLDWMGMPPMQEADGRSHLAALEGSQELAEPVVCEVRAVPHTLGEDRSWVRAALRSERWRWEFRYDLGDGTVEERVTDLGAPARQATTVLAPDTPLPGALRADAVFCAAIERMRARWWAEAEQTAGRAFSLYGVNVGPLVSKRPPPCTPRPAPPR
ncbi:MAG: sulfatase-like hydrolase/transferase, partial [Planctomycetota bacterium]|nr:sulfatase-like hydrolase/transferase [Planctomycetota bacterium]